MTSFMNKGVTDGLDFDREKPLALYVFSGDKVGKLETRIGAFPLI